MQAQRLGHDLPNLPRNSVILPPSGHCLWGTVGRVMTHVLEQRPEVQHFAMLTSSVRGPFYPAASQVSCIADMVIWMCMRDRIGCTSGRVPDQTHSTC